MVDKDFSEHLVDACLSLKCNRRVAKEMNVPIALVKTIRRRLAKNGLIWTIKRGGYALLMTAAVTVPFLLTKKRRSNV